MPNSETFIKLPPSIGMAVLPIIRETVPEDDYSVRNRARTVDSLGAGVGGALVDITIIVATSSPACIAIASIIRKWIQTNSSKKVTITTEKGKIEVENLSANELIDVIEKCKTITFKEE
ncbi:hypothetical protein MN549_25620 [Klebsiella pneumoniae]|uniref:effector-associated constant component EACC1 n=1 Tax=Klebsiella pneumoniae TaxID=573 RepID=UPI0019954014|nr:hypothetical protein [Klebsiella pneumoniae]EMA4569384.1 hypothetical protein [Klebsiella pneumoniae]MBD7804683.1 hypothetical protein [Klebsiella pneumoniae]MDK9904817.1 hypothetical protein [Klebsiella pneumoniae]